MLCLKKEIVNFVLEYYQYSTLITSTVSALHTPNLVCLIDFIFLSEQHANEDVEKMILGNKCDMEDKRQVATSKGDQVWQR